MKRTPPRSRAASPRTTPVRNAKKSRLWIPLSLAGILLIALGAARGEVDTVFRKAIMICLECIGIG